MAVKPLATYGTQKYTSVAHLVTIMAFVFLLLVCLLFVFLCTFNLFKACINRSLVLTERQMSPCGKTRIGNDIHFHSEGHIVIQTDVSQS